MVLMAVRKLVSIATRGVARFGVRTRPLDPERRGIIVLARANVRRLWPLGLSPADDGFDVDADGGRSAVAVKRDRHEGSASGEGVFLVARGYFEGESLTGDLWTKGGREGRALARILWVGSFYFEVGAREGATGEEGSLESKSTIEVTAYEGTEDRTEPSVEIVFGRTTRKRSTEVSVEIATTVRREGPGSAGISGEGNGRRDKNNGMPWTFFDRARFAS